LAVITLGVGWAAQAQISPSFQSFLLTLPTEMNTTDLHLRGKVHRMVIEKYSTKGKKMTYRERQEFMFNERGQLTTFILPGVSQWMGNYEGNRLISSKDQYSAPDFAFDASELYAYDGLNRPTQLTRTTHYLMPPVHTAVEVIQFRYGLNSVSRIETLRGREETSVLYFNENGDYAGTIAPGEPLTQGTLVTYEGPGCRKSLEDKWVIGGTPMYTLDTYEQCLYSDHYFQSPYVVDQTTTTYSNFDQQGNWLLTQTRSGGRVISEERRTLTYLK
jgi:hypothetical protein